MKKIKIFFCLSALISGHFSLATPADAIPVEDGYVQMGKDGSMVHTNQMTNAVTKIAGFDVSEVAVFAPTAAECLKESSFADKVCVPNTSPYIQGAVVVINAALMAAKNASGVNAACSKYGDALKAAKAGMSAYNAGCGYAQMACESSCIKALKELSAASVNPSNQALIEKARVALTTKKSSCDTYKLQIGVGAAGLLQLVADFNNTKKCDDGTKTQEEICRENPALPECAIDCSKEKYAQNIKCICEKNPGTAGCPSNQNQSNNTVSRSNTNNNNNKTIEKEKESVANPDISFGEFPHEKSGAGTAGSAGGSLLNNASTGSQSRGADGSGGGKTKSQFNPNILSGDSSGGGGGYRGGGGSYESSAGGGSGRYQQYLPGGSSDPSRSVAGQGGQAIDVTGGGGKSNWQKVKERYQDKKPNMYGSGE